MGTLGLWGCTGFYELLVSSRMKLWVFRIIFRGKMACLLPQGDLTANFVACLCHLRSNRDEAESK